MFTQLLPGFRHVRTPLITGYLWLLFAWLVLGPERLIPDRDAEGIPGRIADLVNLLGPSSTLVALSVPVFLIGSLLTIPRWPFGLNFEGALEKTDDYYSPVSRWWLQDMGTVCVDLAQRVWDAQVTYSDLLDNPNFARTAGADLLRHTAASGRGAQKAHGP